MESKVRTLKVGDSREKVVELLGKPDADIQYSLVSDVRTINVRFLVYGKRFGLRKTVDGKFPYYQVVRFRISCAQAGDDVVNLDDAGRIQNVWISDKCIVGERW